MLESDVHKLDGLRTYIDGKLRRYSLLFAVNGGSFAIAKLTTDSNDKLLGQLTIQHLALGSIIFTILVMVDIWLFGQMMREKFLGSLAFSKPGKIILLLLGTLVMAAWILVAVG
jgi:hypothetical protein